MSKTDVRYKSDAMDYSTSRDVLVKILEDNGFIDKSLSYDDTYFIKRLTLLNKKIEDLKRQ